MTAITEKSQESGIKMIPGSGAIVRGTKGVYFVFRNRDYADAPV